MDLKFAQELLEENRKTFNEIADEFHQTRKKYSPEIEELKKYVTGNEKVLDLGCGNGRLYEIFKNKNVDYIGVDSSEKLIAKAKEEYGDHFKIADILSLPCTQETSNTAKDKIEGLGCKGLPFSDNYFDSIWVIAVLHHIPSKNLRLEVLKEMRRVLKRGGRVIMTCWNLFQRRYLKLLLKFTFYKILGKSKLDFKDILVPWMETDIQRYYHAFTKRELKKLFQIAGFRIEELKFLKRNNKKINILIIGRKI